MAKAVIPAAAFRHKFGSLDQEHVTALLSHLAGQFLRDSTPTDRRRSQGTPAGRTGSRGAKAGATRSSTPVRSRNQK